MAKEYVPGETKEQRKIRKAKEKGITLKDKVKITSPVIAPPKPAPTPAPIDQITKKITTPYPTKPIAFVLGNGTSRTSIDPNVLVGKGTIYGCNALYRSFSPDYLIAVDTKMIREISNAGYQLTNSVWTNTNKFSREIHKINLFNPNLGWSSGPTALNFASQNGSETIYVLGFDYQGIGRKQELVNNMYAGTENYKNVNDRATYFGNWQRQTSMVIKRNPRTRYIRVVETENCFIPDSLLGLENLQHITIEKFKNILNIS